MKFKWLLLILIFFVWVCLGNLTIGVTRYKLKSNKLNDDIKIVQISDLHNTNWGYTLIKKVKKEKPDLIVITGDLLDYYEPNIDVVKYLLQELKSLCPIYYVTGNHEGYSENLKLFLDFLKEMGIFVLENKSVYINEKIKLIGINDPSIDGFENINVVLKKEKEKDKYNIVLCHRPELFEKYVKSDVDLVITGHAHGGQFRIPFIGGIYVPNQGIFPKYDAGLFKKENTTMVVSRGLGNSVFPIRINNRPELVVIEIY